MRGNGKKNRKPVRIKALRYYCRRASLTVAGQHSRPGIALADWPAISSPLTPDHRANTGSVSCWN